MRWTSPTSSQKPTKDEETKETAGHHQKTKFLKKRKHRLLKTPWQQVCLKSRYQVSMMCSPIKVCEKKVLQKNDVGYILPQLQRCHQHFFIHIPC